MYTHVYTNRCLTSITGHVEKGTLLQKELTWQLNNKIENTFGSPATNNTCYINVTTIRNKGYLKKIMLRGTSLQSSG